MAIEVGFYDPPLPMSASQGEKMTAPLISLASREISDATLYHEIVRARYYGTHPAGASVRVLWYHLGTGEKVFEWTDTWADPTWKWYQVWIGHLPSGEIYKEGTYRVRFDVGGTTVGTADFVITVAPPTPPPAPPVVPPEVPWWEKVIYFDDKGAFHIGPELVPLANLQRWLEDHIFGEKAPLWVKAIFYTVLAVVSGYVLYVIYKGLTSAAAATLTAEAPIEVQQPILNKLVTIPQELGADKITVMLNKVGEVTGAKLYASAGHQALWGIFPKTWKWWLGALTGAMGTGFIMPWLAKEAVWEADVIPLSDAVRDNNWDAVERILPRTRKAVAFYKTVINTVGLLNPVSYFIFKRGIEESEADIAEWERQLAEARPPEIPPEVPPVVPPEEVPPEVGTAWVTIRSSPQGSGIYIDGEYRYQKTNFTLLLKARDKPYYIQLSSPSGYKNPPPKNITVTAGVAQVVDFGSLVPLEPGAPEEPGPPPPEEIPPEVSPEPRPAPTPTKAYVTITSIPSGASIWIDGQQTYTITPFAHLLEEGQHNIQLQLFRYDPVFQNISVEGGINIVKSYSLTPSEVLEPLRPFIPVPLEIPLVPTPPVIVKPNAWEYTITARDIETGAILGAKIIVDGIFTGKYTTNTIILEPEAEYLLRLEAFGYEAAEVLLTTDKLP